MALMLILCYNNTTTLYTIKLCLKVMAILIECYFLTHNDYIIY